MWRRLTNSPALNLLLVFAAGFLLWSAGGMVYDAVILYRERDAIIREIEVAERDAEALKDAEGEAESPYAIEREAKKRFNLKLPGEHVVVVVPEGSGEKSIATSSAFGMALWRMYESWKSMFRTFHTLP